MVRRFVLHMVAALATLAMSPQLRSAELEFSETIVVATRFIIHSDILREDRSVLVYVPQTYPTEAAREQKYPVLYLLDGAAYFNATIGIIHHLGAPGAAVQRIPEHIVVAVSNTKRSRDMTPSHVTDGLYSDGSGGAAQFRKFLKDELVPTIDARYRSSGKRILVGHSLAGLFALDTFIEQRSLFDAYVATDPSLWWDNNLLVRKLASERRSESSSATRLFLAEANTPSYAPSDQERHKAAIAEFRVALEQSASRARSAYQYFENESHLSVPLVGIYRGLLSVYEE